MLELDYITIKGFKSISSCEKLQLEPINIIIGPNGAGKSNFIGVFSFLNAIRNGSLQEYVKKSGGADKILYFGSKHSKEIYIHISFAEGTNQYSIHLEPGDSDNLVPVYEFVYYWNKSKYNQPYNTSISSKNSEAGISERNIQNRVAKYVRNHLDSWRLYHFHDTSSASPMMKTSDLHDNRFLKPDGSNLASFLYYLREKHESSYSLIRRTVQRVAPFFDDFQLEPSKLNPDKIRLEWKHKGSDSYFDASSLSDGSLRFIALCTLLLQPNKYLPSVILIDEPELGLHPYAITMFSSLIKQVSKRSQVIVSTQSPLLLDHFEPEDVLIADRQNKSTVIKRLEVDKLSNWLEDYSLGQLWEKNEFGGRPEAD